MTKLLFALVVGVCAFIALSNACRPAHYECIDASGKVVGTICRDTCFYREGHPCKPCEPYENWKVYIEGCQSKFKNANITKWRRTERDCNRCACECDWQNECTKKSEL